MIHSAPPSSKQRILKVLLHCVVTKHRIAEMRREEDRRVFRTRTPSHATSGSLYGASELPLLLCDVLPNPNLDSPIKRLTYEYLTFEI